MRLKPRIGTYAVYEPTEEGWENAAVQLAQVNDDLQQQGLEVVTAPEAVKDEESCRRVASFFQANSVDVIHPLIVTWSFDHYTYLIQQATSQPVAIRTIPGIRTGSLVGGQQLSSVLFDLGIECRLFFGPLGDQKVAAEAATFTTAWALHQRLIGTTFALLGRRTPGMTNIAVDEIELMRLFGTRLINLGMDEFNARVERISVAEAEEHWRAVAGRAAQVTCNPGSAIKSMQFYLALQQIREEFNLNGATVGSYPACLGMACLPIALLNDEGFPTGCEGDINSTLAMYILSQLTDAPVHFGEILDVDEQTNTIISSHCGSAAPSLADVDGFILCPVRLAHSGVSIRFKSHPGPITYVNLVGRRTNYRLCAFEGNAIPTEMVFEGNPMRIQLNTPFRGIWNAIDTHGFGHHWMAGYARVTPVLVEFCRFTGIQGIFPDLVGRD
jgi:L-fucose isomerase-like protein